MGAPYIQLGMTEVINYLPLPSLSYFTGVVPILQDPSQSIILRRRALMAAQGQVQMPPMVQARSEQSAEN